MSDSNKKKAITLMIIAAVAFSLMNVFVKITTSVPSIEKAWFRNIVGAIVAFVVIILENKNKFTDNNKELLKEMFVPKNKLWLLLRVVFGTCGVILTFYAIDNLILSDASVLSKTSPFFTILFSYILLKEKITKQQAIAIVMAFIGVIFIAKPVFNINLAPYLAALVAAVCAGFSYTILRILGNKGENASVIVFAFCLFSTVAILPLMIPVFVVPDIGSLINIIIASSMASVGQFCLTKAYRLAPAKEISIYDYLQVVFSAIFSVLIFHQAPDILSIVGYIIIISASLYMFYANLYKK